MYMIAPEKDRFTSQQVLQHPLFKNANNIPLSALDFDTKFFIDYYKGSTIKKVSLLYIA